MKYALFTLAMVALVFLVIMPSCQSDFDLEKRAHELCKQRHGVDACGGF